MPDVTIKHGDNEIVVPLESLRMPEGFSVLSSDDLDAKYVPKESVKKDFVPKGEFQRRLSSVTEKAHEDETVIARVLEAHGSKMPNLDEAKQQWEKANLTPLRGKYDTLKDGLKRAQIRELAKDFFDEKLVAPLPGGAPSPIEVAVASQFDLDDTTAGIFPIGPDGKPFIAANPNSHNPHRTAREHFELLAKDPEWERFLIQERRNSGGSGRPGQDGGVTGNVTRKSDIPSDQKVEWMTKHGVRTYMNLPE